jgi:general secretion pathway protein L
MTLVLFPDGARSVVGDADDRVVAVLPGALGTVHRVELPGLTDKQARAAARLIAAEASLSPIDALHVAIGADDDGWRTMVTVEREVMAAFLAALAADGIDPDAVVPATLLLPRPIEGAVRGLVGGEQIVRSANSAYVEEAGLAGLFDEAPADLSLGEVEQTIAARVNVPEVDLRQGVFARSRRWVIDWVAARRLGRLAAILLVLTIAIELIMLMRIDAKAKQIEAANAAAQVTPAQPRALPLAGVAIAAVASTPDTEIAALTVDGAGALRLTARGRSAAALDQLQAKLSGTGLRMTAGPTAMTDGRATRELTLGAP